MTDCTSLSFDFPACRKRRVEADFSGGDITSNGGVLLLRQADRLSGLTASVARRLVDTRQKGKVEHRFEALLRQRVFALALGYEDVNDHAELRHDLALQTAAERDRALASPSTLSRFETAAGRDWAWAIHEALVEDFIASHPEAPKFTNEVQHRYKPELRWARDMTSSILMIVLRFPGCMRPGNLVVRSAT